MDRFHLVQLIVAFAQAVPSFRERLACFPFEPPPTSPRRDRTCARWSHLWHSRAASHRQH